MVPLKNEESMCGTVSSLRIRSIVDRTCLRDQNDWLAPARVEIRQLTRQQIEHAEYIEPYTTGSQGGIQ